MSFAISSTKHIFVHPLVVNSIKKEELVVSIIQLGWASSTGMVTPFDTMASGISYKCVNCCLCILVMVIGSECICMLVGAKRHSKKTMDQLSVWNSEICEN
jgi:hypothetical protein